jgi:hypothetical protein
MAALVLPLSSSPPHHRRKDKTPFSVASTPALALLPSLRSAPCERTLALPLCRAEPSPPSLPPYVGPRCLYVICNYKRELRKLPHPTSLPVCRSRSSSRPQSCSQTSSSHTFTAIELQRRRPRWQAAHGEDLAVAHAIAARRRSRHGGRPTCAFRRRRMLCALQSTERALRRAGLAGSWAVRVDRRSAPGRPHIAT